jgi:hypothetical protein
MIRSETPEVSTTNRDRNTTGSNRTTNTIRTKHNIIERTTGASTPESTAMRRTTTTLLGKDRGSPSTSNGSEDQTHTTIERSISRGRRSGDTLRTLHG